jgi:glycerophosphoryl diester phosphodiesterase
MFHKISLLVLTIFLLVCCQQNQKAVLITGHRGASGLAPENTISAMQKAIEVGSDYSELDVQETSDGVLILLHDSSLKRTTGIEKNIWELDYASLDDLDAGSWFGPEFKGESIPTLEEVMDFVRGKMKLNIEMKVNSHEEMLAERVVKTIEKKDFISECIITSFDFESINKVRALNKKIQVGYLFSKIPEDVDVFAADVDLFSVNYKIVDAEFVKKANANHKSVHVYTVNDPEEMKRLINIGVDNIITDRPDVLKDVLQSL